MAATIQKRFSAKKSTTKYKQRNTVQEKKSTAQAIHIIRRIIDTSIRAGTGLNVVLIDWGKAFDEVSLQGFQDTLERMSIAPTIINNDRRIEH